MVKGFEFQVVIKIMDTAERAVSQCNPSRLPRDCAETTEIQGLIAQLSLQLPVTPEHLVRLTTRVAATSISHCLCAQFTCSEYVWWVEMTVYRQNIVIFIVHSVFVLSQLLYS